MVGRPSKLTDECVSKLEYAFSIGCTDTEACIHADISRNTYYEWIKANQSLSDRFALLKEKPVLRAKKIIDDSLTKGDEQTAKWYLEKRSTEFNPTRKIEGSFSTTLEQDATKL